MFNEDDIDFGSERKKILKDNLRYFRDKTVFSFSYKKN